MCRGRGWHGGSRRARRTAAEASGCSGRRRWAWCSPRCSWRSGTWAAAEHAVRRGRTGATAGRSPTAPGHGAEPLRFAMLGDSTAAGPGRAPGPADAGGAAGLRARRGGGAAGGAAERGAAGRPVGRPGPAGDAAARRPVLGAGRLRDHDRRERRDPPDARRRGRCAICRRRCAGCVRRAPRWSSAPAPTWARSRTSTSRCAGWPGGCSRQLAAAQTIGVVEQGGRTVSLGRPARPGVRGEPAGAVRSGQLPPLRGGVRDGGDGGAADAVRRARPVAGGGAPRRLAARGLPAGGAGGCAGAAEGGTEVAAAMPTGPRGPWALLKRRRRRRIHAPEPSPLPH